MSRAIRTFTRAATGRTASRGGSVSATSSGPCQSAYRACIRRTFATAVPATSSPSASAGAAASRSTDTSSAPSSAAAPLSAAADAPPGALSGIKVLDLSRILAGPFCTQILGDMGAEVWKVENPVGGDDTRFWGPPFVRAPTVPVIASPRSTANAYVSIGESAYFLSANRNKRSLALNLKTEAGRQLVRELARKADVLVENFAPGKLDSMGLGYDALREVNPSLIYASLTGFGSTGPLAQQPGYDVMASARGGLMGITGHPDAPVKVGVAVTDLSSGLYLHGAILAALFARERDPQRRGQHVATNLLEVQVANLANIGQNYHCDPRMRGQRLGTQHESIVPYQAFACRPDGATEDDTAASPVAAAATAASPTVPLTSPAASPPVYSSASASAYVIVGALNNKQFHALGRALESLCASVSGVDTSFMRSELYVNNALRVRNRVSLIAHLQGVFARFTCTQVLAAMDEHGIPAAPLNDIGQTFDDAQVRHSGIVRTVQHEGVGEIRLTGSPVHYSHTPTRISRAPPMLGQHTQQVLQEVLGSSVEQLQHWEKEGVIGCYHAIA